MVSAPNKHVETRGMRMVKYQKQAKRDAVKNKRTWRLLKCAGNAQVHRNRSG